MYNTLLRRWDTDFVANSATLHMTNASGGYEKAYFFGTAFAGEGGIVSTVDDMLRWLAHMDAPTIGTAATWALIKAPQTLANGTSTGYGLGLITERYRGIETLSHSGGGMGGNAQMLKVPAAGLDVIIMVNRADAWAALLAQKVLDACLPALDPIRSPSSGTLAAGIFCSPATKRVVQLYAKDTQQIVSIDGMDIPVEPDGDGVLWPAGMYSYLKQGVTLAGPTENPSSIRLSDFGNVDEFVRAKLPERFNVNVIAGRYRSDATGTEVTIADTNDGPRLTTLGRFGSVVYRLECLAEDIWRLKSMNYGYFGGMLSFDRDSRAFSFSRDRTWALAFRRCA